MGEMIARTGWQMGMDSPNAVVHMRIGEYFFGNHQRKDFGTFQIYHRGPLAIASGLYQGEGQLYGSAHWLNYHHQTIAHNGLLIYDPSEVMAKGAANDGGQRWPNNGNDHPRNLSVLLGKDYRMGQVTAHAIEPDPTAPVVSYLAGDITDAYDAGKVEMVTRSMITVNTGDPARPCVLVVFDRVISTSPLFKKTWLLHSIQEPKIYGTTSYVFRTGKHYEQDEYYSGRMIVDCLLPEDVSVAKIGGPGKEFWIESTNRNYPSTRGGAAEPGAWRIEVSPAIPNHRDTFLHVLTVVDVRIPVEKAAELLSNADLMGASFVNHAVFFSRDGYLLQTADVPLDTSEEKSIFISDLRPGLWVVNEDSGESATVRIGEQSKSLYLDMIEGLLSLEYLSP
jgi:heparin/heparan-sulfate lyase